MRDVKDYKWEEIFKEFGQITEQNKRKYAQVFRDNFNEVNYNIRKYLVIEKTIPIDQIEHYISDFQKVFSSQTKYDIFYFDELLQFEIPTYKNNISSELDLELLSLHLQYEENNNKYRIKIIAEKDGAKGLIKKGDLITEDNFEEFQKYEDYYKYLIEVNGFYEFIGNIHSYKLTYGRLSKRAIKEELETLNSFITSTNDITIKDSFKPQTSMNDKCEYIRLTNGFYEKKYREISSRIDNPFHGHNSLFQSLTAKVYGKYFLYKEWLNQQLKKEENDYDISAEKSEENDLVLSTIEDYLSPYLEQNKLDNKSYDELVKALHLYFVEGKFPKLTNKIHFTNSNKKKIGWDLHQLYKALDNNRKPLKVEYLVFAQKNITNFTSDLFKKENYLKSNLYKYFTTKTQ